jgi:hypothetical protein
MLVLRAKVFSADASTMISTTVRHQVFINDDSRKDQTPEALARYASEKLVSQGADQLIDDPSDPTDQSDR